MSVAYELKQKRAAVPGILPGVDRSKIRWLTGQRVRHVIAKTENEHHSA